MNSSLKSEMSPSLLGFFDIKGWEDDFDGGGSILFYIKASLKGDSMIQHGGFDLITAGHCTVCSFSLS